MGGNAVHFDFKLFFDFFLIQPRTKHITADPSIGALQSGALPSLSDFPDFSLLKKHHLDGE